MHRSIILNFKESNFGDMVGPPSPIAVEWGLDMEDVLFESKDSKEVRTPLWIQIRLEWR